MSLWKIAWRGLQQRSLSSSLTCLTMALGVALVVSVLLVHAVVNDSFNRNASLGYHLVVGGKNGSKLDLVLTTVYHLGRADEPVPYSYYKEFITTEDADGNVQQGKFAAYAELAVPMCVGDSYEGFRVVATTPGMFEFNFSDEGYQYSKGECFESKNYFDAVIGSAVARATDLNVGDTFKPTHGMASEDGHVHEDLFKVVGILKPSGTPNDRVLFINIEGFYLLENHAKSEEPTTEGESTEHSASGDSHFRTVSYFQTDSHDDADHQHDPDHAHDETEAAAHDEHDHAEHDHSSHAQHDHSAHAHTPLPESQREVSAILVLCPFGYSGDLNQKINEGQIAQSAYPVRQVQLMLSTFIDPLRWVLLSLTILTVIVAGVGVMVSIYNSMIGRRHEIAVMRALGAGRRTVMTIVMLESVMLSVGGGVIGVVLGHAIVGAASPYLISYTGVSINFFQFDVWELVLIPALVLLASIVGYLPALSAYRTDVSRALTAGG